MTIFLIDPVSLQVTPQWVSAELDNDDLDMRYGDFWFRNREDAVAEVQVILHELGL